MLQLTYHCMNHNLKDSRATRLCTELDVVHMSCMHSNKPQRGHITLLSRRRGMFCALFNSSGRLCNIGSTELILVHCCPGALFHNLMAAVHAGLHHRGPYHIYHVPLRGLVAFGLHKCNHYCMNCPLTIGAPCRSKDLFTEISQYIAEGNSFAAQAIGLLHLLVTLPSLAIRKQNDFLIEIFLLCKQVAGIFN